jgi:hypothetical protein
MSHNGAPPCLKADGTWPKGERQWFTMVPGGERIDGTAGV